jgi:hypothetical protein
MPSFADVIWRGVKAGVTGGGVSRIVLYDTDTRSPML